MKIYDFIYNNNDSRHKLWDDADALAKAKEELFELNKLNPETTRCNIFEVEDDSTHKYVKTIQIERYINVIDAYEQWSEIRDILNKNRQ